MTIASDLFTLLGGRFLFERHPTLRLVEAQDRGLTLMRFEGDRSRRIRITLDGDGQSYTLVGLRNAVETARWSDVAPSRLLDTLAEALGASPKGVV